MTDIKGTTRDILKETISYKGFKINFIDTAGIRESDDVVEKIGVDRSINAIKNSDIVLCVFDSSEPLDDEDNKLLDLVKDKNVIFVLNKTDKKIVTKIDNAVYVCANENKNIDEIKDRIIEMARLNKIDFSQVYLTNKRHIEIIKTAIDLTNNAIEVAKTGTADLVDMEAKRVWLELGKITGENATDDILTAIFSKFCLGK